MSCNNVQILNFNHNIVEVGPDNKIVITDQVKCNSITIPQPVTNILQINSPGPQGPAGTGGGGGGSLSGGVNNYIPLWSGSTALTSSIASQQTGSITFNTPTVNVNDLSSWFGYVDVYGSTLTLPFDFGLSFISSTTSSITINGNIESTLGIPFPWIWTSIQLTDNSANSVTINDPYYTDISSIVFYSQSFNGGNYTVFYSSSTSPGTVFPNTIYTSVTNVLPRIYVNGDLEVSGSIIGSLAGTASWATNAVAANYATIAGDANTVSVRTAGTTLYSSNPLAGQGASNIRSIFLGQSAGYQATSAQESIFLGYNTGYQATLANSSIFMGGGAGYSASFAANSIFIGANAGSNAKLAANSAFIGIGAGNNSVSASYSTIIGYFSGFFPSLASGSLNSIKSNNVIIGNYIGLPAGAQNSINLGAIIFATGSYLPTDFTYLYSGSYTGSVNGRVGINVVSPRYTLDVSGSGNYTNGLTVTGSLAVTGSLTMSPTSSFVLPLTASTSPAIGSAYWSGSFLFVYNGTRYMSSSFA